MFIPTCIITVESTAQIEAQPSVERGLTPTRHLLAAARLLDASQESSPPDENHATVVVCLEFLLFSGLAIREPGSEFEAEIKSLCLEKRSAQVVFPDTQSAQRKANFKF